MEVAIKFCEFLKRHLWFCILIIAASTLFIALPKSLRGMDDVVYLNMAKNIFSNIPSTYYHENAKNISTNIFEFRTVWLFLVWTGIKLFGAKPLAIFFPAMLSTLATAFFVYNMSVYRKNLATALFLFCPAVFSLSFQGTPDTSLMFFFTLSYFFLNRYLKKDGKNWINAILLCSSLFLGFFVKELIVFFIPLLFFHFVLDLKNKQKLKFWAYISVFGAILLSIYFAWQWNRYNDIFHRANVFTKNQYISHCSYDILPKIELLKRLTLGFPFMIISTLSIIVFAPLYQYTKNKNLSIKSLHLIILLLVSNFASIKISSYSPMCLEIRHYLFLFPIAIITLAELEDLKLERWKRLSIQIVLLTLFSIILWLKIFLKKDYDIANTEIFFFIALIMVTLFLEKSKYATLAVILIFLAFSINRQVFEYKNHILEYKNYLKLEVDRETPS